MSYARWTKTSNVYVYHWTEKPLIRCHGCILHPVTEEPDTLYSDTFSKRSTLIMHLLRHREVGHLVEDETIWALASDIAAIGDQVTDEAGPNS